MECLPPDVWFVIFRDLTVNDVLALESTCRAFRDFVNTEETWRFLKNQSFRKRRRREPVSAKKDYIHAYKLIDWNESSDVITYQMRHILKQHRTFQCQPPVGSSGRIFDLLSNDYFYGFSERESIGEDLHSSCINYKFNTTVALFLARFFPQMLRPILFNRVGCWGNHCLIDMLLFAVELPKNTEAIEGFIELLKHWPDQIMQYVVRPSKRQRTDVDFYTTSLFRLLILCGASKSVSFLLSRTQDFSLFHSQIMMIDDCEDDILDDIAFCRDNVRMLDILYE